MNKTVFNPLATKLYPWQVAIMRRTFVTFATLPMIWSEAYLKTFWEVFQHATKTTEH